MFTAAFNNLPVGSYSIQDARYNGFLFNIHNQAYQPLYISAGSPSYGYGIPSQVTDPAVYGTNPPNNTLYVNVGQKSAQLFSFRIFAGNYQPLNITGFNFEIKTFPDGRSVDGKVGSFSIQQVGGPARTSASSVLSGNYARATFNSPVTIAAGGSAAFAIYGDIDSSLPSGNLGITLKQIMNTGNIFVANSNSVSGVISVQVMPQPISASLGPVSLSDYGLYSGQTYRIKWESKNVDKVYIKLRKNSVGDTVRAVADVMPNNGYYDWTVPTDLADGYDYVIRVLSATGQLTADTQPFGIKSNTVRVGSLINKSGTVYLVGQKGLYGFPDLATFNSWGYTFSQVVTANSAESALSQIGVVPMRNPYCNNPLDQINGVCGGQNIVPAISNLNPSSGPLGTQVIITGSGFTPTGNKVKFGNFGIEDNPSYRLNSSDGKTLVFTVPSNNYVACLSAMPPCGVSLTLIPPGIYQVSVINANGTSNSVSFTVTKTTASNPITIATKDSLNAVRGQYFHATFYVSGGNSTGTAQYVITTSADLVGGLRFTQTYCPPTTGTTCAQVVSPNSITLYGTPTQVGAYNFSIKAVDSQGNANYQSFVLNVVAEPTLDTTTNTQQPTQSPSTAQPRVGSLINNKDYVRLVGSNGLYGFSDLTTFNSWGFTFSQIVAANSAEAALPQVGWVPTKAANCTSPLSQIAGTCR